MSRYKAEPGTKVGWVNDKGEAQPAVEFDEQGYAEVSGEAEKALEGPMALGLVSRARGKE